jgi:hypothetical protein
MGLGARLLTALGRRRAPAPPPLTVEDEEARRQADLLERDFAERGPGRWRKVGTLRHRD